jgi:hypothetical protein
VPPSTPKESLGFSPRGMFLRILPRIRPLPAACSGTLNGPQFSRISKSTDTAVFERARLHEHLQNRGCNIFERARLQPCRLPRQKRAWALQAAEKLDTEGGGGFNPRISPPESTPALAAEERLPPIRPKSQVFPQPVQPPRAVFRHPAQDSASSRSLFSRRGPLPRKQLKRSSCPKSRTDFPAESTDCRRGRAVNPPSLKCQSLFVGGHGFLSLGIIEKKRASGCHLLALPGPKGET